MQKIYAILKKSALLLPVLAVYTAAGIIGGTERGTLPGVALFGLIPCAAVVILAAWIAEKKTGGAEK